eukprot:Tamp_27159.p1 GENE.Tamp_27159~~Tamp_27159.p1  ORF type:complete len:230 (-),score=51.70 Tamp_27159:96-785(-)
MRRRYTETCTGVFEVWKTAVASCLCRLRLRLRCVQKVVGMRKRHLFECWFRVFVRQRYHELEDLKMHEDKEVRDSMAARQRITALLQNKEAEMEQLHLALSSRHQEVQELLAKVESLEHARFVLESNAQAAAGAMEEAMAQVAAEQGAGSARLMALHKRASDLEQKLRASTARNSRLESILEKFGSPAALHCLEKLNSSADAPSLNNARTDPTSSYVALQPSSRFSQLL